MLHDSDLFFPVSWFLVRFWGHSGQWSVRVVFHPVGWFFIKPTECSSLLVRTNVQYVYFCSQIISLFSNGKFSIRNYKNQVPCSIIHADKRVQESPCESKDLQKSVQKPDCFLLQDVWPCHLVLKHKYELFLIRMY